MPTYTIREIDARFVIATDQQDILICNDRQIALSVAAAAVVGRDETQPLAYRDSEERGQHRQGDELQQPDQDISSDLMQRDAG